MIYSIVPIEQILFNQEDHNPALRMEVTLQGEQVVLVRNEDNTYRIDRLISTNPKAYMMKELMPGNIIMAMEFNEQTSRASWKIKSLE